MSRKKNIALILNQLKEHLNFKTNAEFAEFLGIKPTTLSSWYSRNSMDYDLVYAKCEEKIDANWLLSGEGNMLKGVETNGSNKNVQLIESKLLDMENSVEHGQLLGKDTYNVNIPIVDISAAAGYGYINPDHTDPIGVLKLPSSMLKTGKHYGIRVKGFSMLPTLHDSDYLIVRYLEHSEWETMPDEHIYLVVDKDGLSFIKRVRNRFNKGFIVLSSDSLDKANYPNFNLQHDEIHNIFHAEWLFSAKMENINDAFYLRLKNLEDTVDELNQYLQQKK